MRRTWAVLLIALASACDAAITAPPDPEQLTVHLIKFPDTIVTGTLVRTRPATIEVLGSFEVWGRRVAPTLVTEGDALVLDLRVDRSVDYLSGFRVPRRMMAVIRPVPSGTYAFRVRDMTGVVFDKRIVVPDE